jgi:hypothetical protein
MFSDPIVSFDLCISSMCQPEDLVPPSVMDLMPIVHVFEGTRERKIAPRVAKFEGSSYMWKAKVQKLKKEKYSCLFPLSHLVSMGRIAHPTTSTEPPSSDGQVLSGRGLVNLESSVPLQVLMFDLVDGIDLLTPIPPSIAHPSLVQSGKKAIIRAMVNSRANVEGEASENIQSIQPLRKNGRTSETKIPKHKTSENPEMTSGSDIRGKRRRLREQFEKILQSSPSAFANPFSSSSTPTLVHGNTSSNAASSHTDVDLATLSASLLSQVPSTTINS